MQKWGFAKCPFAKEVLGMFSGANFPKEKKNEKKRRKKGETQKNSNFKMRNR